MVKTSRRVKGELTRQKILEAALRVIANHGYKAVTHRAIAKEADVNLSLTTYYFKDLNELVSEAFVFYKKGIRKEVDSQWQQVFHYLEQYDHHQLKETAIRCQIADKLADFMVGYLEKHVKNNPQGVAVEMTFFFDLHLNESQRELAYELRSRFLTDFIKLCEKLGTADPNTDAELLMGNLQRLECQAVAVPRFYNSQIIHTQTKRLLGALLGENCIR